MCCVSRWLNILLSQVLYDNVFIYLVLFIFYILSVKIKTLHFLAEPTILFSWASTNKYILNMRGKGSLHLSTSIPHALSLTAGLLTGGMQDEKYKENEGKRPEHISHTRTC